VGTIHITRQQLGVGGKHLAILAGLGLLASCGQGLDKNPDTTDGPRFSDIPLSYLPFANSFKDQPPSSIGLLNSEDFNDSIRGDIVSNSGKPDFLFDTAFDYRSDKTTALPPVRDRDYNATLIFDGQYDTSTRHVTNFHTDSFLFTKNSRLYRQPIWQTRSSAAQVISSGARFNVGNLCQLNGKGDNKGKFLLVGQDYQNVDNSIIVYKEAMLSQNDKNQRVKLCDANSATWRFVALNASESMLPLEIPHKLAGTIFQPVHDVNSGVLTGWVVNDATGSLRHYTRDFNSYTSIPVPTTNGDADTSNDWIVWLGEEENGSSIWFATHGVHLHRYNTQSKTLVTPPGGNMPSFSAVPDSNHALQVFGAFKHNQYPLFAFDSNYLYFVIRNTQVATTGTDGTPLYHFIVRRIPAAGTSSMPETLAQFLAHDLGKMLLTDNKLVLSVSDQEDTSEGSRFVLIDKNSTSLEPMHVTPITGHKCLFNLIASGTRVFGNSLALESCRKPTTQDTHVHFFQFDESGQGSYIDNKQSRILAAEYTSEYSPFARSQTIKTLVVKRNMVSAGTNWTDSFRVFNPALAQDTAILGEISGKNEAMSARVTLMPGFTVGMVETQLSVERQKLFAYSLLQDNSLKEISPGFSSEASHRWVSPFTLPP